MNQQSLQAAMWMVLACVGFACMSGLIRYVAESLPPLEIVFFRNLFGLLALAPWFWRHGLGGLKTARFGLLLTRSVSGLAAMSAWFVALTLIPLADVTALSFTAPLFATVLAVLFLGEIVRARRWLATLVGFAGAMIILRPGMQSLESGALLAIFAASMMACSSIFLKKLTSSESPEKCVAWAHLLMTPASLIPALWVWQWPDGLSYVWLIGIGVMAVMSHVSMNRAIKLGDLTAVLPYDFTRLPFVALIGYLAFGQTPDLWVWTGAAVIFSSTIYITHREVRGKVGRSLPGSATAAEQGKAL